LDPTGCVDCGVHTLVRGTPGCKISTSLELVLTAKTDSNGQYSRTFNVPNNEFLICLPVYMQFFPHDKSVNFFGVSSSNYGRILVGR
jgi:hypothetical protein